MMIIYPEGPGFYLPVQKPPSRWEATRAQHLIAMRRSWAVAIRQSSVLPHHARVRRHQIHEGRCS